MADFSKILQELKSKSIEIRLLNIQKLVEHVEDCQELPNEVTSGLKKLVLSADQLERTTGLCALIRLCKVANESNLNSLAYHFIQYVSLKNVLTRDEEVISLASSALGVLVSSPNTTTFELADEELRYALNILKNDTSRDGQPRYHACCEIKELALKLPILFAVYLGEFLGAMWNAVRDQKDYIRETGVETFALALSQLESRDDLLESVYIECMRGIHSDQNPGVVHGCLLTLHQLVEKSLSMVQGRLNEIVDSLLRIKDHKNPTVRQAVIAFVPCLGEFMVSHRMFQEGPMGVLMGFLLKVANGNVKDLRVKALATLGKLAIILGRHFQEYLPQVVALANGEVRKKPILPAAFELLRGLAIGQGGRMAEHFNVDLLVVNIFSAAEIGVELLDCLSALNTAFAASGDQGGKPFVFTICEKLLLLLHGFLNQRPEKQASLPRNEQGTLATELTDFSFATKFAGRQRQLTAAASTALVRSACFECAEHTTKLPLVLALFALSRFDFRGTFALGSLVHSCVLPYLEDACFIVRKHAVITTCALLRCPRRSNIGVVMRNELYNTIERMLNVALTDQSEEVRCTLFKHIRSEFFVFLALEDNLSKLMVAANDSSIKVRRACVKLLGRLASYNSSFILPCLTQLLSQYMSALQISGRYKQQQDAAVLVRALIRNTKQLVSPNLGSILNIFIAIIQTSQNAQLIYQALKGVSACAEVCKSQILPHCDALFPCLVENIKDPSAIRRKGALLALLDLVAFTTRAVQPFLRYETLLEAILEIIRSEERLEIRKLAEKALGKIGALDPLRYKELMKKRHSGLKSYKHAPGERHLNELFQKILELTPSHDIYYPLVAIKALLSILIGSHSLSQEHVDMLLTALTSIFRCYTSSLSTLLEHIIPILVHAYKQPDNSSKERFLATFREITAIVGDDINEHVPLIADIIDLSSLDSPLINKMLKLLHELATHSCYDTMSSFPQLLHHCIHILNMATDENLIKNTLSFFKYLKGKIDQYLYIIVPAILKIIKENYQIDIRRQAARVIADMCDKNAHPHIVDYISRIVDTFISVIKTDNNEITTDILDALADIVVSLGNTFAAYIPVIQRLLVTKKVFHKRYEGAVQELIAETEEVESPIRRNRIGTYHSNSNERISTFSEINTGSIIIPYKRDVNVDQLLSICNTTSRQTKEEWKDWIRRFGNELLKQAPAPALRECQVIEEYPASMELFNAAFVSCWSDLYDEDKNMMIKYLESAFDSPSIPTEVLQVLLNLAEFMEHDDHKLFDARTLWKLAYKCKAYAKALHYKEVEFYTSASTSEIVESLISLNNLLNQHEAASGIRTFAQKKGWVDQTQNWLQEFHRWQDAEELHESINERLIIDPQAANRKDLTLIRMKCLHALSDWNKLMSLAETKWHAGETDLAFRKEVASNAAAAAWNLGRWEDLERFTLEMDSSSFEQTFYQAILTIRDSQLHQTKRILEKAWDLVDARLPGLMRESYSRAYPLVIECQQLCDLEEVIQFKEAEETLEKREEILKLWNARLKGCHPSIDIWEKFLSFRPLLVCPEDDLETWIQFAELCMKNGQMRLAGDTLETLLLRSNSDKPQSTHIYESISGNPELIPANVCFVYLKYMYKQGQKTNALNYLQEFVKEQQSQGAPAHSLSKYFLKLATWQKGSMQDAFNQTVLDLALQSIHTATQYDPKAHKAWHKWGIFNFEVLTHLERSFSSQDRLEEHTKNALEGFIHSISLEYSLLSSHKLQNLLRLVTLWFKYGNKPQISEKLRNSFDVLNVEVWLQVIPQIIARSSTTDLQLKGQIIDLLKRISKKHPHALVYPLTMATRTNSREKMELANVVLEEMQDQYPQIVKDTLLVTDELIRCSVLWRELWEEAISEASQLFFGNKDAQGMISMLLPLHKQLREGVQTVNEVGFSQAYAADLNEAEFWLKRYEKTQKEICLHQAWNIYYNIYLKLSKVTIKTLEMENVSHLLSSAENLHADIPGTYRSAKEPVYVYKFKKILEVFQTKQHPRKLSIIGSNGKEYQFLLKGREDIRQDERAMQLFGLVNDLLAADANTNGKDLAIRRYAVVPLSPTCGLIGWVHGSDTINQLIQEYRQRKRIETYVERDLIKGMYAKYDRLPVTNKIEIFEFAMSQTKGEELQKILWSKSSTSEVWLERRTNYTRSLATMSMVGYVLGLGDRHPSNLMLDRYTGKIVHIDFGDCFEVAMKRERCPERVPFRLTRMLVNAMEISGIEGNFRNTCEQVMTVLRMEKDSLMAMLEVFLYEPLVSWRIIHQEQHKSLDEDEHRVNQPNSIVEGEMNELLNAKAIEVLDRILEKLTGNDFPETKELSVNEQVDRLIREARSIKNLAQSYIGWCPFW